MRPDFKDKERQATTRDGEPIWTVRLDAIDHDRETKETIWVEVAGEQPRLPSTRAALRQSTHPANDRDTGRCGRRSSPRSAVNS